MFALPGSAYMYQGEELGLPEVIDIPDEKRQDPTFRRTKGERYGRDGCRVPLPWEAQSPAFGFNRSGESWLPQPEVFGSLARDVQVGNKSSTLELYRAILSLRHELDLGRGSLEWLAGFPEHVVAFTNNTVAIIANTGSHPVELPAGKIVLSSGLVEGNLLPSDTTVWMTLA
jgi:alpha-glucosidase